MPAFGCLDGSVKPGLESLQEEGRNPWLINPPNHNVFGINLQTYVDAQHLDSEQDSESCYSSPRYSGEEVSDVNQQGYARYDYDYSHGPYDDDLSLPLPPCLPALYSPRVHVPNNTLPASGFTAFARCPPPSNTANISSSSAPAPSYYTQSLMHLISAPPSNYTETMMGPLNRSSTSPAPSSYTQSSVPPLNYYPLPNISFPPSPVPPNFSAASSRYATNSVTPSTIMCNPYGFGTPTSQASNYNFWDTQNSNPYGFGIPISQTSGTTRDPNAYGANPNYYAGMQTTSHMYGTSTAQSIPAGHSVEPSYPQPGDKISPQKSEIQPPAGGVDKDGIMNKENEIKEHAKILNSLGSVEEKRLRQADIKRRADALRVKTSPDLILEIIYSMSILVERTARKALLEGRYLSSHAKFSKSAAEALHCCLGVAQDYDDLVTTIQISNSRSNAQHHIEDHLKTAEIQPTLSDIFKLQQDNRQVCLEIQKALSDHKNMLAEAQNGLNLLVNTTSGTQSPPTSTPQSTLGFEEHGVFGNQSGLSVKDRYDGAKRYTQSDVFSTPENTYEEEEDFCLQELFYTDDQQYDASELNRRVVDDVESEEEEEFCLHDFFNTEDQHDASKLNRRVAAKQDCLLNLARNVEKGRSVDDGDSWEYVD